MIRSLAIIFTVLLLLANQATAKEYVVKLKNHTRHVTSNHAYEVVGVQEGLKLIKVEADDTVDETEQKALLSKYFDAEYVVENVRFHAFIDDSDPKRREQWALNIVNAKKAWDISAGSASVVVAVIDTGVSLKHEDLKDNLWVNQDEIPNNNIDDDHNGYIDDINGWDFHAQDSDPNDETSIQNPGHGTHCSGIIGASCGNGVGICGISPEVSIMALRFLGSDGSGDLFASTQAIEYAVKNGAHIISASWGANIPMASAQPIIDAIKMAEEKGVIFIAAASNDGQSNDHESIYPANAQTPNMISVAASDSSDQKPSWSNYGRKVDLAAPGADILSTIPNGYSKLSGTSMATPLVAGIVALMKAVDKSLSGAQARSILQSSGTSVSIDTASNRRVDAHKALDFVKNRTLTLVPAAHTLKVNDQFAFSAWGGVGPYKFVSQNPSVATIDESGKLVAKAIGDVTIEVSDSLGAKASSVSIKIGDGSDGGGGGGGGIGSCPINNPVLCLILCTINPDLPWCKDLPLPMP